VRVVAATNRDLQAEVEAGNFRQDLFYRLSVFPIEVPPLRQRKEDIVPLTMHFLQIIAAELGKEPLQLSRQHADSLLAHHWPGNVRELRNVVERAMILSSGHHLRLDLAMPQTETGSSLVRSEALAGHGFVTDAEIRLREKENMLLVLDHSNWKISGAGGAAQLLGVKPSTMAYRMKVCGIEKPR